MAESLFLFASSLPDPACHQAQVLLHRDGGGQAWALYGEVSFPCGQLDGREPLPFCFLPAGPCVAATRRALRTSIMIGGGSEGMEGVEGDRLVCTEHGAAPRAGNALRRLHRLVAAQPLWLPALSALATGWWR